MATDAGIWWPGHSVEMWPCEVDVYKGEGVWTSASVGRMEGFGNTGHRWPWGMGWTTTQNFGDVFYGWPLISQNDDQRQYHLWRIADEISVITIFYQTVFTCVLNASNVGSRTLKTSKELVTNMQPLDLNWKLKNAVQPFITTRMPF